MAHFVGDDGIIVVDVELIKEGARRGGPAHDEYSVRLDGRRIETAEDVRALIKEFEELQRRIAAEEADLSLDR